MTKPATPEAIERFLNTHSEWKAGGDEVLMRGIKTKSFNQSLEYAQEIGNIADSSNHHPILTLEYSQILIVLTTHDAGNKITVKDIDMAEKLDTIVVPSNMGQ